MTPLAFKLARVANGLSQQQMADRLQVSRQTVSNWERGVFVIPYDLKTLATALTTVLHTQTA